MSTTTVISNAALLSAARNAHDLLRRVSRQVAPRQAIGPEVGLRLNRDGEGPVVTFGFRVNGLGKNHSVGAVADLCRMFYEQRPWPELPAVSVKPDPTTPGVFNVRLSW